MCRSIPRRGERGGEGRGGEGGEGTGGEGRTINGNRHLEAKACDSETTTVPKRAGETERPKRGRREAEERPRKTENAPKRKSK